MGNQRTFASMAWQAKGKVTRRERFLAEMDAVIPWTRLLGLIAAHYPKAGNGRQPLGMEKMLRIYFLQQWFNLSDPAAEEALYDSSAMRRFVDIDLGPDRRLGGCRGGLRRSLGRRRPFRRRRSQHPVAAP